MEALSVQDEPRFWQTVIVFIAVLVIYALLPAGYTYLRDRFRIGSPAILQPAQIGAIELPVIAILLLPHLNFRHSDRA
jgi:hypothetical protein